MAGFPCSPAMKIRGGCVERDSLNGDSLLGVLVNLDLFVQCFLLHPSGAGVSWFPAFILDTPSKIP